ncbi:TPA: hypothetical protein O7Y06_001747 [Salmonella enterica]|nr:hypothetical protein [Salmonella enterica]EKL0000589.1 hypothetical protein [Salmonella enterica]EKL0002258.1 hypothetical protein [Salmonella enterica]EKO9614488.1 hypothetical protein [Salmonella enterica]EMD0638159.1 hypothetical protein [Salmonella enterica]
MWLWRPVIGLSGFGFWSRDIGGFEKLRLRTIRRVIISAISTYWGDSVMVASVFSEADDVQFYLPEGRSTG